MSKEKTKIIPKLFIATPMYGGMCHGIYAYSMIQMDNMCIQKKISFIYKYITNESLITRARNSLASEFMDSDCTHLMFIDSDIGFNPTDIISMIEADKDIICGLYPKKEIDWIQVEKAVKSGVPMNELYKHTGAFVVNLMNNATHVTGKIDEPIQIANGGTGFMLIQRRVFEALAEKVPEYNSDMFLATDTERKPKAIKEYFATSIDKTLGNRLLAEDYHFCKIARAQGFTVWAAPWAELTHCGSYNFSGRLSRI